MSDARALHLLVRTPQGLVVDERVAAVTAEDLDGWFGILPGRADVVAALPPGLLVYRRLPSTEPGGGSRTPMYLAHIGGLLDLEAGTCRVMCRDAALSPEISDVVGQLERAAAMRRERGSLHQDVMTGLVREALLRSARGLRT